MQASEIGDTENISKSYVSRILRLTLLSPDIIEAILGGGADQSLMLARLERPLPASWQEQRSLAFASITPPVVPACRANHKPGEVAAASPARASK